MTPDSHLDSQLEAQPVESMYGDTEQPATAGKVPRAERLAQLGLKFTKGLPENIRDIVAARKTGFRFVLSDGKSDKAVRGLYLRVGAAGDSVFWLQFYTAKGERRQFKIGKLALAAARTEAKKILANVESGVDPWAEEKAAKQRAATAKARTLAAFLEHVYRPEYLDHQSDGKGTYTRLIAIWKPLLDKSLDAITSSEIEKVLATRKAQGIKAGTMHRDWGALRAAFNVAVKRGLMTALPISYGERPVPIGGKKMRPDRRVRWIHDEVREGEEESERARFTQALANAPLLIQAVARLALSTGMRRGEILSLTNAQIHPDHIELPRAKTKSGNDEIVYLNAAASAALKLWTVRGLKGELFPVARFGGTKLALERKVERMWKTVCRKAKISDLHFHDTRHDFAVRMLRAGATLEQVRDALRHSSITMTERYAHLVPSDVRAAVMRVTA